MNKDDRKPDRQRTRLPLSLAVGLAIGALMLVAVGTVLAISLVGAGKNTSALLSDKTNLMLETVISQIRAQLDPAAQAVDFLARRMQDGGINIDDRTAVTLALQSAHAGLDQVTGILFVRPDTSAIGVRKLRNGGLAVGNFDIERPRLDVMMAAIEENPDRPHWGAPSWSDELQTSVLNVVRGVVVDGRVVGAVGAGVSIQQFSAFLGGLNDTLGQHYFALAGPDQVLAHPLLAGLYNSLSADQPLPSLQDFPDRVLSNIWVASQSEAIDIVNFRPGASGHYLDIEGEGYIFVYERLDGYSDRSITVGAYFSDEDVGKEVERLIGIAIAGALIIIVSILLSFVIAKKIARPFTRVAMESNRVGDMALEDIHDLPSSRIREIDDQARAFNGMVRALRWLEIYVPRRLARRLLAATGGSVTSQEAEVAVMFTDIAGFTGWSEDRPAAEVADFLNAHFAVIGQAVDSTGGTLDKFIGDGAMAFWGAPEAQTDYATRACRAAKQIAAAITHENTQRQAAGEPQMRVRIGIHCGAVVVGNIGAPERMNYTIVGDTVNVCQRLEQAGKDIPEDDAESVVVIVSEAVAERLTPVDRSALQSAGTVNLRGRLEPIEIFRMNPGLIVDEPVAD